MRNTPHQPLSTPKHLVYLVRIDYCPNSVHIARMKLAEYIKAVDMTPAKFAAEIGVSRQAVEHYCAGDRVPRPVTMARIRRATNGRVTADDFYDEVADPLVRAA